MPASRTSLHNMPGRSIVAPNTVPEAPHGEDDDPLREEAHRLDAEHWSLYQHPISADTPPLKGSASARHDRALIHDVRKPPG